MSHTSSLPPDQLDVISAARYGTEGYPHDAWTRLRREAPVCWMEPPRYKPFWAITKHADIVEISKQPDKFRSAGRFITVVGIPKSRTVPMASARPAHSFRQNR